MTTQKLFNYCKLMRLNKPIGIWLLLWPTLWALWVASEGWPNQNLFIIFTLGVIIMRSAGCVLNDYVDQNIDLHVKRTQMRPIVSGQISSKEALVLFILLGLAAISLAMMLNRMTQLLATIAASLTIIYPFIKRFFSLPQFVLGIAFGWAIPMVFAAVTGGVPIIAWLLFGTVVIWAVIYDTFYAMIDRNDDIKVGVKSTAILFGDADLFIIAGLQSIMLVMLIFIGFFIKLSIWFFSSIFIASIFMIYHLWLARNREPHGCYAAFKNNHIIGLVIFFGFLIHYTFNPG
ncbi:MAG: 4-hydroxybenzoate octaprenyltransferase [Gammaproteobacteria bacterium]|nr:4-hydroxybenzoate octaprenyltransferase [Gammaproteobacteria bacterium]|tara:strand:- start:13513 stop:14379 length:867 start_codon:yes stop_codon:yes gene_type:complete